MTITVRGPGARFGSFQRSLSGSGVAPQAVVATRRTTLKPWGSPPIAEILPPKNLPGPGVSVRQHPRFRVAQARALQSALFRSTLLLAVASIASGAPLVWLYPREGSALAIVGAVEAAIWAGLALLIRRAARRYLAPLAACCALLVLPGPLLTIAMLPAQYATTLAYLVVIPLAVALFVPWDARAHALWLVLYVGAGAGFARSPWAAALTTDQRLGLAIALAGAGLASFGGQRLLQQAREREFAEHLRLRALNALARTQGAELKALNRELAESARIDPLTGLFNRRQLSEDLVVLWDRHVRYGHEYAAVLLDLDHFKALNDQAGHLAGDATLRSVADALHAGTRPGDRVYRFGGEEFLVLLPEASADAARAAAERLRQAVGALAITHPDNGPLRTLTISAGVALMSTEMDATVDDWLRRADAALYRAKAEGRNRVDG